MTSPVLSPSAPRSCPAGHPQPDTAARFCRECGLPMGVAPPPDVEPQRPSAACAAHPEVLTQVACPRCGTFACDACLRTQPDGQVLCFRCAEREAQSLPWDRADVGRLRAFWQTCMLILQRPTATFATAQPHASLGSSVWFAMLANIAGSITTFVLYIGIFGAAMVVAMMSPSAKGNSTEVAIGLAIAIVVMIIAVPITILGYTLMRAGMDHLLLRVIRANPGPFSVTMRAHALSIAPGIVGLIPICGLYVWPIWAVVVRVFAYRGLHRISTTQAVIGALFFPILGTVVGIVGYVALIAFSISQGSP